MLIPLNAIHRRVLGVLMEKSMTTPGGYPLTLNAMVVGSNQLTCREPVMHLSEGDVSRAVMQLQSPACGQLVKQAPPDRTARANRFEHQAEARFGWDKRERAIMAELLLRGPQTAGELKTNASRMTPLDDIQVVMNLLTEFARHEPPYVRELPRQPGKNTTRFDHLFYLPDEQAASDAVVETTTPSPAPRSSLEERIERLEAEVAMLRQRVEDLTGHPPGGAAE